MCYHRGLKSDGNEGVLHIPQISSTTGASLLDCLVSYLGHSLGESYPSVEKQSVYSANWTNNKLVLLLVWKIHKEWNDM